jgi:hypothetical protein
MNQYKDLFAGQKSSDLVADINKVSSELLFIRSQPVPTAYCPVKRFVVGPNCSNDKSTT